MGDKDHGLVDGAALRIKKCAAGELPVRKDRQALTGRKRKNAAGKVDAAVTRHAQDADAAADQTGRDGGDGMCHKNHLRESPGSVGRGFYGLLEHDVHALEQERVHVENRFVAELAVDIGHVDDGVEHADMAEDLAALRAEQDGIALAAEDQLLEV